MDEKRKNAINVVHKNFGNRPDALFYERGAQSVVGDEQTISKVLRIAPQFEEMSLEEIAAHDALWRNAAFARGV